MAQKQPVKLQELVKLGAAGIKPEDLNFKSVTMDSGARLPVAFSRLRPAQRRLVRRAAPGEAARR
jgi:hypothetical protein|eukprot:COSAG06_NODE_4487_length_4209_cov_18.427494_2_plen_65_part_00